MGRNHIALFYCHGFYSAPGLSLLIMPKKKKGNGQLKRITRTETRCAQLLGRSGGLKTQQKRRKRAKKRS